MLRSLALALALIAIQLDCHARIVRDKSQVARFRAEQPCPVTGRAKGACPGWQVDHIIPLCAGGQDSRANMQWITVEDHRFKTFVDVRECRRRPY